MFLDGTPTGSGPGWSTMTDTPVGVSPLEKKAAKKAAAPGEAVRQLVGTARARGEDLTGPGGC